MGRRNLTDSNRAYLRGKRYETEKKTIGRQPVTLNFDTNSLESNTQIGQSDLIVSTAEKIADQTGVSEKTIKRDAQFAKAVDEVRKVDPELAQKVLDEDINISRPDVIAMKKIFLMAGSNLEDFELLRRLPQGTGWLAE